MGYILDRIRGWLYPDLFGGRSSQWSRVRKDNIKSYCELCERKGKLLHPLELHHIRPFHLHPELELEPSNFITLCRKCHLDFAHLGDFKSFNADIQSEAEHWRLKRKQRV